MEKSIKEYEDLVLQPGKIVTVKPIKRRKPYLKKGHDGEDIYTGCSKSSGLPYDVGKRSYVNPFTKGQERAEQEAFEVLLNQKEGSLNLYNYKVSEPNFWGNFMIRNTKEGIKLDLGSPKDALMYRIIKVDPKYASNSYEIGIAEKLFNIIDDSEEKRLVTDLSKKKSKANDYMYQIKKSKKDMLDTLRLLDKQVSPDSEKEWLEAELFKIIDEVSVNRGVSGLDRFIEVMEDSTKDVRLFVIDAINGKEIIRDANGFKIADSNTFVGRKHAEIVQYFLSKDPKVQEQKLIIQDRLR